MNLFPSAPSGLKARLPMIRFFTFAMLASFTLSFAHAATPAWWYQRGMISGFEQDDYAVLNAGQLKNAVRASVDEMNAKLTGGAGQALNDLVADWVANNATADNEVAVNQGQVMAAVKPWYDRLNDVHGTPSYYPWNGSTPDDFAVANIGQLKNLLARDVTVAPTADQSTAPSMVEAASDADADGLPLWAEVLLGTDAGDADTDDDTVADGDEDADADEVINKLEVQYGYDPKSAISVAPLVLTIVAGQNGFAMAGEIVSPLQVRATRRLAPSDPTADIPAVNHQVTFTASTGGLRVGVSGAWTSALQLTTAANGLTAAFAYQTSATPGPATVTGQISGSAATATFNLTSDVDTDGDGFGDRLENSTGGNANDPLVLPGGQMAQNPASFTLTWKYSTHGASTWKWYWHSNSNTTHSAQSHVSDAAAPGGIRWIPYDQSAGPPPAINTLLGQAGYPNTPVQMAPFHASELSGGHNEYKTSTHFDDYSQADVDITRHDVSRYQIRLSSNVLLPAGHSVTMLPVVRTYPIGQAQSAVITVRTPVTFTILPTKAESEPREVVVPAASDGERVEVRLVRLEMMVVDRDDPTKAWIDSKSHSINSPVFAGESCGDMVSWKLGNTSSWASTTLSWAAEGPNGETVTGPSGVGKSEWKIADGDLDTTNDWLKWRPGKWKIRVQAGQSHAEFEQEIGVRSTDVVVIGWIDPAGVPLSSAGVSADVLKYYPISGVFSSSGLKLITIAHLGLVSQGSLMRPVSPWAMTPADRDYILNWMFKQGGNAAPPASFADEAALQAFKATGTNYKLFNRLQIRFLVNDTGTEFKGVPVGLSAATTEIGITQDPIFGRKVKGTSGPNEGKRQIKDNKVYHQTNDGSPDDLAVGAFNTLADPLKWNHIGSTISLGIDFGFRFEVLNQVYPTYFIYERQKDGKFDLKEQRPQAPNPKDNCNSSPYDPPALGPAPFIIP